MTTDLSADIDRRHAEQQWREFRTARDSQLAKPYGFLSQVGLHWLDAEPQRIAGLPGSWRVIDDAVEVSGAGTELIKLDGGTAVADGERVAVAEAGSSIAYEAAAGLRIEVIRRSGRYALRLLASNNPRRARFFGVDSFAYDADWVLSGEFEQVAADTVRVDGALPGLVHDLGVVGRLRLVHEDHQLDLILTGDPASPSLLFSDATSSRQTPAWRVVPVHVDGAVALIDLNRAVNFPAGFSIHATCPRPPRANHLPFAVIAGERLVEVTAR